MYNGSRVVIMSIAKSTVRLFDIDKQEYINKWIKADDIEGIPIQKELVEKIASEFRLRCTYTFVGDICKVYFQGKPFKVIRYLHELENLIKFIETDE